MRGTFLDIPLSTFVCYRRLLHALLLYRAEFRDSELRPLKTCFVKHHISARSLFFS